MVAGMCAHGIGDRGVLERARDDEALPGQLEAVDPDSVLVYRPSGGSSKQARNPRARCHGSECKA
jgi:hypothetical protein